MMGHRRVAVGAGPGRPLSKNEKEEDRNCAEPADLSSLCMFA